MNEWIKWEHEPGVNSEPWDEETHLTYKCKWTSKTVRYLNGINKRDSVSSHWHIVLTVCLWAGDGTVTSLRFLLHLFQDETWLRSKAPYELVIRSFIYLSIHGRMSEIIRTGSLWYGLDCCVHQRLWVLALSGSPFQYLARLQNSVLHGGNDWGRSVQFYAWLTDTE